MGAYLSEPVTEKVSSDEGNEKLECGASSMQGWRVNQEVSWWQGVFLLHIDKIQLAAATSFTHTLQS